MTTASLCTDIKLGGNNILAQFGEVYRKNQVNPSCVELTTKCHLCVKTCAHISIVDPMKMINHFDTTVFS